MAVQYQLVPHLHQVRQAPDESLLDGENRKGVNILHNAVRVTTDKWPPRTPTMRFGRASSPVGEQYPVVAVLVLVSFSLDTLLALILGASLLSAGADERKPRRSAVSAERRGEAAAETRAVTHSESLRAETEPTRLRRGCASMSRRDSPPRPDGGLEVELVVDTSDATDARSASARSVSEVSPSRARRRREARVGRGLGSAAACLLIEDDAAAWRLRPVLEEPFLADLPSYPEYVSWSEERISEMGKEEV